MGTGKCSDGTPNTPSGMCFKACKDLQAKRGFGSALLVFLGILASDLRGI